MSELLPEAPGQQVLAQPGFLPCHVHSPSLALLLPRDGQSGTRGFCCGAAGRTSPLGGHCALGVLAVLSSMTAGTLSHESLSPRHSTHGLAPGHSGAGWALGK